MFVANHKPKLNPNPDPESNVTLICSMRRAQDAPYLLEPLATGFGDEEVPVRLALLTAALKLFFARPPECQALLGAALAAAAADANQDVRDRGLMYYRRVSGCAQASCWPLTSCSWSWCWPMSSWGRGGWPMFQSLRAALYT